MRLQSDAQKIYRATCSELRALVRGTENRHDALRAVCFERYDWRYRVGFSNGQLQALETLQARSTSGDWFAGLCEVKQAARKNSNSASRKLVLDLHKLSLSSLRGSIVLWLS